MSRLRAHVLPLALYAVVAVVLYFPASLQPGRWVLEGAFYIGELGNIFLLRQGLFGAGESIVFTDWLNYPDGGSLVFMGWVNLAVTLVLERVVSTLAAYNLSILLLLILAGWSGFLLVYHLTGDRWTAWVAGLVFGFNPFILSVVHNGQIAYANHAWLALYALCLVRWLRYARWPDLLGVALLSAVNLLSCPYFAVFAWVFTPLPVLAWLLIQPRRWLQTALRASAVLAAGGLAQVPPYLYFRLLDTLPEDQQLLPAPLCEVEQALHSMAIGGTNAMFRPEWGSAGVLSVFLPLTRWRDGEVVHVPYLGVVVGILLVGVFVVARLRKQGVERSSPLPRPWVWALGAIAFFVLALGSFLCVEQGAVYMPGGSPLPLPFMALWKHAPLFQRICTPYRFVVMLALCATPLLGLGLEAALRGLGTRVRAGILAALSIALLVDFTLLSPVPWPFQWKPYTVPAVYEVLRQDREGYAILEVPYREPKGRQFWRKDPDVLLSSGWNERLAFFQTVHQKRITLRMAQTTLPLTYQNSLYARQVADLVADRNPGDAVRAAQGVHKEIVDVCAPQPVDHWLLGNNFQRLVYHENEVPEGRRACLQKFLDGSLKTLQRWPEDGIVLYDLSRR